MLSLLMATALSAADVRVMPDFLSDADKARLISLKRATQLFKGEHRAYFLADGRTQHHYKTEIIDGRPVTPYVVANPLRLAALKVADLLCLQSPIIAAPDGNNGQSDAIRRIDKDSGFAAVLYETVLQSGYQGESFWQIVIRDDLGTPTGGAAIVNVPADVCFPDTDSLKPNGVYGRIVKQWLVSVPGTNGKIRLLRREVHEPGVVRNELHQVNERGAIQRRVALDQLPETAGLADEQPTGATMPLLQAVPNLLIDGKPIGDFDDCGIDTLLDQINASATQIARVLRKHADPKLGVPEDLFDESGQVRATDELFAFKSKDETPFYIVWQAQLDSAFRMLDWALRQFLILTEISPSLIGMKEGAAAEAWKKLRLEAAPTLAKVARKLLTIDRAVKDIWTSTFQCENAVVPGLAYEWGEVDVTWRDGLPQDEDSQATVQATLKGAGLISTAQAVAERLGDPQQAAEEVARIEAEAEARTARLFQGGALDFAGNG